MEIEEPKKTVGVLVFGVIFPLFGIFLFSRMIYMGISLQDIFVQFGTNFVNASFEWFYSLFKGDIVNQISQFGIISFTMQPLMPSLLVWISTGFFIGVIIKKFKKSFLIILISITILLGLFVIFAALTNSLSLIFSSDLDKFLGSLLIPVIFSPLGAFLGGLAGKN
jgi:hypothetical protein